MPADLWRFAQEFYQRPGVEAACLQLQAQGADVCLLICAIWLGGRGVACTAARAEQLRQSAAPWQSEVVAPLRRLRQDWRGAAQDDNELAALRAGIKQLELQAESVQLQRLASCSASWPTRVAQDLPAWLEQLTPAAARTDRAALQQLCGSALPD